MKLGVIGSRGFNNYAYLEQCIDELRASLPIDAIVSGGAKGADSLAELYAQKHDLFMIVHLPDYDRHKKKAPFIRNTLIVDDSDVIIAFWDGKSTGTLDSLKKAEARKIPVKIIRYMDSKSTTLDVF